MVTNLDFNAIQLDSIDDDEEESIRKHMRSHSSEDDFPGKEQLETEENDNGDPTSSEKVTAGQEDSASAVEVSKLRMLHGLSKLSSLQIPSRNDLLDRFKSENEISESTAEEQINIMFEEKEEETKEETIPEESIFRRINSHKGMKSFQLGKQLSCKWSTGAGPRIGCLRDYPSGLQSHALEQVNLSPRSKRRLKFEFPSRASTPNSSNLSRSSSHILGHSFHM